MTVNRYKYLRSLRSRKYLCVFISPVQIEMKSVTSMSFAWNGIEFSANEAMLMTKPHVSVEN